jgi:hypothetical protein
MPGRGGDMPGGRRLRSRPLIDAIRRMILTAGPRCFLVVPDDQEAFMSDTHHGSCLCGTISFSVSGPLREVVFCHCGQCRKQTGLFYASTNASDADLKISGAESISWYQSSPTARRGFCKHCGSALFWKYDGLDVTSIQAGAFDKPTGLVAGYHIFCADKGDFYDIDDGLPQYGKDRPGLTTNSD